MFRSLVVRTFGGIFLISLAITDGFASGIPIPINSPMAPPSWALLERELLRALEQACQRFFARYFDERGYLLCVTRWGADDGPDDAIENLAEWPLIHALGGDDVVKQLYMKGWEGHLRQYTEARTFRVEMARDGMYFREFPVSLDWLHHGEGLTLFAFQGLSNPNDDAFRRRVVRFAGFYMNEDPLAANYDPKHKLIRSLFNGSRGPLLRPATAIDWAGDPVEVEGRFRPRHGERTYAEMLEHFRDYGDIVGDHPQNLLATSLALYAYMATGQPKYRKWILEYVEAWRQRMIDNQGIIPTKIGLDGRIGGPEGKWFGGVYGWGFSVTDPVTGKVVHRNQHASGLIGFGNAYLVTKDDRFLEVWRKQIDLVNSNRKVIDGVEQYPRMYGNQGWYDFSPQKYDHGALELYLWSMSASDRERLSGHPWLAFLEGMDPTYPERSLRGEFSALQGKMTAMDSDDSTPDTRLSDDPMVYSPTEVRVLVQLAMGGLHPGHRGGPLHCRVRYHDPIRRRPGLPPDVAALVERLTDTETVVTVVNINQCEPRRVLLQAGAYGEHRWTSAQVDGQEHPVNHSSLVIVLGPGAGGRVTLKGNRYVNQPSLTLPFDHQ